MGAACPPPAGLTLPAAAQERRLLLAPTPRPLPAWLTKRMQSQPGAASPGRRAEASPNFIPCPLRASFPKEEPDSGRPAKEFDRKM